MHRLMLVMAVLVWMMSISAQPPDDKRLLYGVFENGEGLDDAALEAMIRDLQARDMNVIAFTSTTPDLTAVDELGMNIIAAPMGPLFEPWFFNEDVQVDLETAREVITPVITNLQQYASVRGYNLLDDATPAYSEKLRLAVEVIRELDPDNPASPTMVRNRQGQEVYEAVQSDVFLTYYNPVRNFNAFCDFYGQQGTRGWVDTIRMTTQGKAPETPLWLVLQAHATVTGPDDTNPGHLREPIVEEVRLLNWLALGEDAEAIFWFVYSTLEGHPWRGLEDNPVLFAEITRLAGRVREMEPVLLATRKIADRFYASAPGGAYASTLYDDETGQYYVLAANEACTPQDITITSPYFFGALRDVETGTVHILGDPIELRGGDGKLFELVEARALTDALRLQPNLALNGSFETLSSDSAFAANWRPEGEVTLDEADPYHGGSAVQLNGTSGRVVQFLALEPDTEYYLSHWVRAEDLENSTVGMRYVQGNDPITIYFETYWAQSGSYDWTKRIAYFKTLPNLEQGLLEINWVLSPGATAWIDHVVLCEVDAPCEDSYLAEVSPDISE